MWPLRSLGYRTDLFLCAFDGVVEERDRYRVMRTPSNPESWRGNFLLYPDAPRGRDGERGHPGSWLDDHARELPNIAAKLFAWDRTDGEAGDTAPFLREGFAIDQGVILTAASSDLRRPERYASDVEVAPLTTDSHWERATDALVNAFAPNRSGTLDGLRAFVARQLARYRAMQLVGLGQWYGAFVEGAIAGTLGVVHQRELGRFQLVGTDPRFARRGVCSTLVYEAARRSFEAMHVETLVMAADATYHAARIYESVGFHATERLTALIKRPPRA